MKRFYPSRLSLCSKTLVFSFIMAIFFSGFTRANGYAPYQTSSTVTILPIADASVRDGSSANTNFGLDSVLNVKTSTAGNNRSTYLKFPLNKIGNVVSAKLRIYGRNVENSSAITTSVLGVDNDLWTETGLNWNNAPAALPSALGSFAVNNIGKYYELDITAFAQSQFTKDKMLSLLVKDLTTQNRLLAFNSREYFLYRPELVIVTSAPLPVASNAQLFVENLHRFPSNDYFVTSRIQTPWSRDRVIYNTNHDTVLIRLHNKGMSSLVVSDLALSNKNDWEIQTLKGAAYNPATSLPLTISSGSYADLRILFKAYDPNPIRVKFLFDELMIVSNDDNQPYKSVYLRGLWQREGEGSREPRAQEMITTFGFRTSTGFTATDPDRGASGKPKGGEIISSYFVRADPARPVTVRQMGAYHGCCNQSESLKWFAKGNSASLITTANHINEDAQRLLPRRNRNATYAAAEGSFNPTSPFGFKVGSKDWTDTLLNPERRIGIRVWKAIDPRGRVIPNAYIIANDYLGTSATNYDYNDNMYYITNIRPELGPASVSPLVATPSAVEFGERLLQSTTAFTLNLKNLGQVYGTGIKDPSINITAVQIVGENSTEFTAAMPAKALLGAQETTTLALGFKPTSEGLKIADLLIYHDNAAVPLRVPLYGIAKATGTTVSVLYRIKSGSSTNVTVNGKTWVADTPYAFDNLEPYSNTQLSQISATDEDALYLRELSSNGEKRPFRYEMPIANGSYRVRLHFAEIYWGAPGSGLAGGPGSRVMSVRLENVLSLVNLDVAQQVGSASAVIKNIPVTVTDGKLNINFSASANRPMICAIEVYQFKAGSTQLVSSAESPAEEGLALQETGRLQVYPNPARQNFAVQFPSTIKGSVTLQLTDLSGRVYELGRSPLQGSGLVNVDVARLNLPPGIYLLRAVTQDNNVHFSKLHLY